MVKRIVKVAIKVVIIAALLVGIAFLIKDSSDKWRGDVYDVAAPTEAKFAKIERWLPVDAELIVVADLHRFFGEPGARARTTRKLDAVGALWGVDAGLLRALMSHAEKVGLAAIAIGLDPGNGKAEGLVVVQGDFQETAFVAKVEELLTSQGAKLVKEDQHPVAIYVEPSSDDGFAFAFPDRFHLVLGPKGAIVKMVEHESSDTLQEKSPIPWAKVSKGATLFGRFKVTPRIAKLLPEDLKGIVMATFASDAALNFKATIPCASSRQAEYLLMFIEGSRISFLIAERADTAMVRLLRSVRVGNLENTVEIRVSVGEIF